MERLNQIKHEALKVLLKETFSHVTAMVYKAHMELVQKNNLIRGTQSRYFVHNGDLYPMQTPEGLSTLGMQVRAQPLHWSLTGEFDETMKLIQTAEHSFIKNYFTDVLNITANGLVLEALLPSVLVDALRHKFRKETFETLNHGGTWRFGVPPTKEKTDEEVLADIAQVQDHYGDAVLKLRELLMDKLLLE